MVCPHLSGCAFRVRENVKCADLQRRTRIRVEALSFVQDIIIPGTRAEVP